MGEIEYKSTLWQKIKNFFSRFLVYQMILIWLYMRYADLDKSTNDFKTRVTKNLNQLNLKGPFIDYFIEDPSIIHILITLSETISFVGAIFGFKLFTWLMGCHFALTTIIYFNPILPENSFSLLKFDIRFDMLTSIAVLFCFFMIAYYPYSYKEDEHHILDDIKDDKDEIEDEKKQKGKKKLKTK